MMGSSVSTSSNAVDNRQAVTDQALGISTYAGKVAYAAPIFDFSQHMSKSGKGGSVVSGGLGGGGVDISILDGGAINRAFDFAESSISQLFAGVINSQNQAAAQAAAIADTTAAALQQSTESAQAAQDAAAGNYRTAQKWIAGGLLAVGFWWAFMKKGRK